MEIILKIVLEEVDAFNVCRRTYHCLEMILDIQEKIKQERKSWVFI